MKNGLIAKKVGMTRVFDDAGKHVPVTVLHVEDAQVTQVKTADKDGYSAVQIAAFAQKASRVTKPMQGHFAKAKVEPKARLAEFRIENAESFEVGQAMKVDVFSEGQFVDVAGISIGKGFAGGMKRHGFGGLRASHGVSVSHRAHGSTGQCQDPGRVFKGKKMAGHMGAKRRTQQSLKVIKVDVEKGVLLVKGSVPGSRGAMVWIKDAVKKSAPSA